MGERTRVRQGNATDGVVAAYPSEVHRGDPLLTIEGLRTHFVTTEGVVKAADGVDLTVRAGQTLCVVGESGCGKSVTARSILQLVEKPGRIVEGRIQWRTRGADEGWFDLTGLDPRGEQMRAVRGGEIGMVFQEPIASLSPMYTVGDQLVETIRLHLGLSKSAAYDKAVQELRRVGIPQPERHMSSYPFQLSGGMCQRVMIAIALSCDPGLLIADEPTTALDVTTQARILDLILDLQEQTGLAVMFITHDLGVVAEIADEVVVMYLGTVVESGPVGQIFDSPQHPYTQALLESIPTTAATNRGRLPAIRGTVPHPQDRPMGCPFQPRCAHAIPELCQTTTPPLVQLGNGQQARCHLHTTDGRAASRPSNIAPAPSAEVAIAPPRRPRNNAAPLLEVRDLAVSFPIRHGAIFRRAVDHVRAVDGVDLTIRPGETLGLVGESGCGKTTLGRSIARAIKPTSGSIAYRDSDGAVTDLTDLSHHALRRYHREIRLIFQDPFSSLNPRMTLLQLVGEPLRTNNIASGSELQDRVATMLRKVGLRPEYLHRYPHAFSGGERQRINIARALITEPRLVIADEAVSALDVSVRAQILNLLRDLQDEFDLTYLFISHDMSVVRHICDRVAVMYLGTIVEITETETLFTGPHHPYTEALLSAIPRPDPHRARRSTRHLTGEIPDAGDPPAGCRFHPRCPHVQPERCGSEIPLLRTTGHNHDTACHFAGGMDLEGADAGISST